MNEDELRATVVALCRDNQKIEAIKVYRQVTGKGLAESKNDVEAWARGETLAAPFVVQAVQGGGESVEALIRAGQKINAIKLYREQTGKGLAEAKYAVEAMEAALARGEPIGVPTPASHMSSYVAPPPSSPFGASPKPAQKAHPVDHPSHTRKPFGEELPSEVSSGGAMAIVLLALVLGCTVGGYFLLLR